MASLKVGKDYSLMHCKFSALDVNCKEILRMAFPPPLSLPATQGQDDARDTLPAEFAAGTLHSLGEVG